MELEEKNKEKIMGMEGLSAPVPDAKNEKVDAKAEEINALLHEFKRLDGFRERKENELLGGEIIGDLAAAEKMLLQITEEKNTVLGKLWELRNKGKPEVQENN